MQPDVIRTNEDGPKRLLFIVSLYSSSNTDNAGHCYSIRELSTQFARSWPECAIQVLVLGNLTPGPLRDAVVPITQIDFTDISAPAFVKKILAFGDAFAPTHVHSFDNKSHFFGRWIAARTGAKTYLTKPGGPNPGRFFPYAADIVCFSEENLRALRSRRALRDARFHYLPQRVSTPVVDQVRIDLLRARIGPGDVLLRICRVGPYYERSIRQTFALAKALRSQGRAIRALIVGTVQSQETLEQLAPLTSEGDIIINDPIFTHNAAAIIPIAAGVVGAGRSLIEAALLGKTVFAPVADDGLPVLVTKENWQYLSATNFSERTPRPAEFPDLPAVVTILAQSDLSANNEIRNAMSIDAAISQYAAMYNASQNQRKKPIDFAVNAGAVITNYLSSKRRGSS